jgi:ribosomal protein L39E
LMVVLPKQNRTDPGWIVHRKSNTFVTLVASRHYRAGASRAKRRAFRRRMIKQQREVCSSISGRLTQ